MSTLAIARPPAIGAPLERVEDGRFLSGQGRYVDDIHLEGMLFAAVLRSPLGHGYMRDIDTSEARAMPGVKAVYTHKDIDPALRIPMRTSGLPGYERSFLQPPLASRKVRYVGEPVALVVASSPFLAEDALERITVEYDSLPAVTDWESAQGPSILHEDAGTNIASQYRVARGDVESAFRTAPYTRRVRLYCHRHSAMPMETRGLLAHWDQDKGRLQVWGAAKVAFANRKILSKLLGMDEMSIELLEVDIGGGFGVRGEFYPEDFLIPFAACSLQAPVKWIEDRREHMMATNHAREVSCDIEIACDRDGTIVGLQGEVMVDLGAYVRTNGAMAPSNVAAFLPGPYRIANFACDVNVFTSNKTPIGSYRGPGRFEANFFRERVIDIAAGELNIDPVDMRRRNLLSPQELPYDPGALIPNVTSSPYDSGDYRLTLDTVLERSDWHALKARSGQQIDGWYHGVGLSCFVESGGAGPREAARLSLAPDGSIDLFTGCSTLGQGHETVLAQVAADELGIPPSIIRVFHGSTTLVEEGFGTYGGRAAVMGGSAVLVAARNFIEALRPIAVSVLGHPNEELSWRDGQFVSAGDDERAGLEELAEAARTLGQSVEASGVFASSKLTFSYGANVAHVAVDVKTGRVKVLDYWAAEDIGRVINPLVTHGQMIGGIVQGLGGTFLDEFIYDQDGQLLNASFADYLLPTASDFPNIHSFTLEVATSPGNPLGVKAAGEGGIVSVAATIANAVSAALAPLGAQINALPITPVRVWRAVRDASVQNAERNAS
jgi:carbon-monoxide dehydrogenase large subunit